MKLKGAKVGAGPLLKKQITISCTIDKRSINEQISRLVKNIQAQFTYFQRSLQVVSALP
jgi:hypothetical protein